MSRTNNKKKVCKKLTFIRIKYMYIIFFGVSPIFLTTLCSLFKHLINNETQEVSQ